MGETVIEKIIRNNVGKTVKPGDIVTVNVDRVMIHDIFIPFVAEKFEEMGFTKLWDPDKAVLIYDHLVPASQLDDTRHFHAGDDFARKYGMKNVHRSDGICHQLMTEAGYVKPGNIVFGTDSHTTTYGCVGAFSSGIGYTEMASILGTGTMWIKVPETIKVVIEGELPENVMSKDIILRLIGDLGADGATYRALEFTGSTVKNMTVASRMTMANMAIEAGAKCALFTPDEKTAEYCDIELNEFQKSLTGDEDATYMKTITYRAEDFVPVMACWQMPIDSGNLALKGLDDLFSTEENRHEEQREQVQQIPIDALHPFTNHPFKVLDDEAMTRTVESIAQYGVLAPLIARPRPEGGYEIISGHRRQYAAKLAGLDTLPVIVRQMSDDAAVILMVDSNLQREHILPSERAFAYKMKLEALKNQGARSDLTSSQVGMKLQALDIVGQEAGDSRNQVHRFIRLTNLIPELLDMVDEKKISFNPAVELSYLDEAQQRDFLQAMDETQNAPSLSQAQRMKKLAQEEKFTYEAAFAIMGEAKKDELDKVVIKNDTLKKYFPRSYTPRQMEDVIIKLLEQWQRRQQRQNER